LSAVERLSGQKIGRSHILAPRCLLPESHMSCRRTKPPSRQSERLFARPGYSREEHLDQKRNRVGWELTLLRESRRWRDLLPARAVQGIQKGQQVLFGLLIQEEGR